MWDTVLLGRVVHLEVKSFLQVCTHDGDVALRAFTLERVGRLLLDVELWNASSEKSNLGKPANKRLHLFRVKIWSAALKNP